MNWTALGRGIPPTDAMHNAALRTKIETALNELVAYEEGMRFQSLAVVLAKRRWPELVASERKKDHGLDAYVTRDQATDQVGRGLACSITATFDKIAGDAKKIAAILPDQIQQLIFATSARVATGKKVEWADKIRKEYGYGLVVISREDIVTSLTDPQNVALCRTYLNLEVEIDAAVVSIISAIRTAASDEIGNWARRVTGQPLIDLQYTGVEASSIDGDATWTIADIARALGDGRRLVLEGPAGRGKTTTLIQLAQGPLRGRGLVFLVDLPQWVQSGREILPFMTGMAAFLREGITPQQLAKSESAEQFFFLLNGWNEVSESFSMSASLRLGDLERQFPSAGILVATRTHYVPPPLPGAMRLRPRGVGSRARAAYIRERLGANAEALLTAIKADPALNDLTRTPFVLHTVTASVAAGGPIPRSQLSVIETAIRLQEQSPEHAGPLRLAPVAGMSSTFLEALAIRMVPNGTVSLTEAEARAAVHRASEELAVNGQLLPHPAPADILNALTAHHVLERFEYPEPGYRFAHQLFEEYYASRMLKTRFEAIVAAGQARVSRANFIRDFLNEPAWTEPLRMLAEGVSDARPNEAVDNSQASVNVLVDMALFVDLVFAAQLASTLGLRSSDPAAQTLSTRLREWYASTDEHHRHCALAGMLASGMDAFRDIIEPLLSAEDDQVRLRTYRLWPSLDPAVLGADWQSVVNEWSVEARVTLVSEILHRRFAPDVSAFGLADPSPGVKEATIDALSWIGAEEEYLRASSALGDVAFLRLLAGTPTEMIPAELRPRTTRLLRLSLEETTDIAKRMRVLLRLHELRDSEASGELKTALEQIPDDQFRDPLEHTIASVLDLLQETDADWTTRWVARRIADGKLWSEWWSKYLTTTIPDDVRQEQFDRLATQNLEHRYNGPIAIVARVASADVARQAYLRLLEVRRVILAAPPTPDMPESEILRQLETLLRTIPPATVVSGVSDLLLAAPEPEVIEAFVHLYGRTAVTDTDTLTLDDEARSLVRGYLKSSVPLILEQEDFAGAVKAELGSALSQVGEPEDIQDLMRLVRADLNRVSDGRAARARGEQTKEAQGAWISWTTLYVSAIVRLLGDNADDVLLGLFGESEYERSLLEEYARQFTGPEGHGLSRRLDYARIWQARGLEAKPLTQGSRRARVAEAIRTRMRRLEDTRAAEADPKYLNSRLKMWALGLASVAPRQFSDEIIALLSLPAEFDAHTCVQALERLLFAGASLPSDRCLPLLDASLARMKQWGVQDQDRWVLVRFLCICLFVDDPAAGLEKMRQVIQQAHLHIYDVRDLLPALGHSRFEGALPFMLELVARKQDWRAIEHEWINALTDLKTGSAHRIFLGLVDPTLPDLPFVLDWSSSERVAAQIAEIAGHDPVVEARLRELSLLSLDEPRRQLLARALAVRGNPEAQLALLNLLDDGRQPRVPWGVERSMEQIFIREQAHPTHANAITRHASASNPVRTRLYSMVHEDERRKHSAYSVLGQIEEWRLEYGRPNEEPRHPDIGSGLPWPLPEPQ